MTNSESKIADDAYIVEMMSRLRSFFRELWAGRLSIIKYTVLGSLLGLFVAVGSPVEYSASMRLVPYRNTGGATGFSGLAGLAGIRLPVGLGDQTITSDLYPEIFKSLDFRLSIAETPLTFSTLQKDVSFIDYSKYHHKSSPTELLTSYTFGLPAIIFSKYLATKEPTLKGTDTLKSRIPSYERDLLNTINNLGDRLTIITDKRTGILVVKATMPDPYAAADLVRISSDKLMQRVVEFDSQKARQQLNYISKLFTDAKARYERAEQNLAVFNDRNRILLSATAQVNRDRLQRESSMAYELFEQLGRELEQARIKANQDTPVFAVLDPVTVPNSKSSPNRLAILVLASLASFAGSLGIATFRILSSRLY